MRTTDRTAWDMYVDNQGISIGVGWEGLGGQNQAGTWLGTDREEWKKMRVHEEKTDRIEWGGLC